jgi:phosphoribosyl-ATP pyrophosphohydrolase/phosphoribosyl-AMP cyclohydrolase
MKPDFAKHADGLMPVVIQDADTRQVLMVAYMNDEAWTRTREEKRVTFYSRSKGRLWTKGETSGHYLEVDDIRLDCDRDAALIRVRPAGPVCHTGSRSCFGDADASGFLHALQRIIDDRLRAPFSGSYTQRLQAAGVQKIAQKVGEEAVECILEALTPDTGRLKEEAADLLFHLMVLLRTKGVALEDIEAILAARHHGTVGAPTRESGAM